MKFLFITILAFLSTASEADNKQADIDKIVLISDFIEESNCDYFYYNHFNKLEMISAGSISDECLEKYLISTKDSLTESNWIEFMNYLSIGRKYSLLHELDKINSKKYGYDPENNFLFHICKVHLKHIKDNESLSEMCLSRFKI